MAGTSEQVKKLVEQEKQKAAALLKKLGEAKKAVKDLKTAGEKVKKDLAQESD